MLKSKKLSLFIAVLCLCTICFAFLHLSSREDIPENALKITVNEKVVYVDINQLPYQSVSGVRMNGKGQEILVEGLGISLKTLLNLEGIDHYERIILIAEDSYQVEVTKNEVNEEGKVYLMYEDRLRLVVFGDTNSKRSVSNVVELIVES